jgi:hypothetical protein
MAGKLVADTLESATGGRPNVTKGAFVQAWVKFTGATGVIDKSFNVSSITRNAAGDHTVNFTNAFADTGYAISGSVAFANGSGLTGWYESTTTARTTTTIRLFSCQNAGAGTDSTAHTVIATGTN